MNTRVKFGFLQIFVLYLLACCGLRAGDEQWDERIGTNTAFTTYAQLAIYRGEVYGASFKWNGNSQGLWTEQGSGFAKTLFADKLCVSGWALNMGRQEGSVDCWDGSGWQALLPNRFTLSDFGCGQVSALMAYGTDLVAGGDICALNSLAQWDGMGWSALGGGVTSGGVSGMVYALAARGTLLFVGGVFDVAGNVAATNLAIWNGANWSRFDRPFLVPVRALQFQGDDLLVAEGVRLQRWQGGTNWTLLGVANGEIITIGVDHNDIYIGGRFTSVNGILANNIARLQGTNWSALGSGLVGSRFPSTPAGVEHLIAWKNDIFASGNFTSAGGKPSLFFAVWHNVALECNNSGGMMQLSWPAFATNYVLEANIGVASQGWTPVSPPPQTNSYVAPASGSNQFFRLRRP